MTYKIECRPENKPIIVKDVKGYKNGIFYEFNKEIDYLIKDDTLELEWLGTENCPDNGSTYTINYTQQINHGLTDDRPGSVVNTLVSAFSREIELLYEQMEQVYKAGFIDTAKGNALDRVVALLGITRKNATPSKGKVVFWRNNEPKEVLYHEKITYNYKVTDYSLKTFPVKDMVVIKGIKDNVDHIFEQNKDYLLIDNRVRWIKQGGEIPDDKTEFTIEYIYHEVIKVPKGTEISTEYESFGDTIIFKTIEEGFLEKKENDRFEASIMAEAINEIGNKTNVPASSIKIMPKPVEGVDGVYNPFIMQGGSDPESDDSIRDRTKHVLDLHGKATLESLKRVITSIEGVKSFLIIDRPNFVLGEVKIIIDGGDYQKVCQEVEETRAAGIRVEVELPQTVSVNLTAIVTVQRSIIKENMVSKSKTEAQIINDIQIEVKRNIEGFINKLEIGTTIIVNRLISSVLSNNINIVDIDVNIQPIRNNITIDNDSIIDKSDQISRNAVARGTLVESFNESAKEITLLKNEIFRPGIIDVICTIIE